MPEMVRHPRPADEGASKNVFKVALFKMIIRKNDDQKERKKAIVLLRKEIMNKLVVDPLQQ
jgi:hypothetical protein